jgi:hypothetical protein
VFTLWRQPMIPLQMREGAWADYKTVTLASGQRSEDLVRVQCIGQAAGNQRGWLVEMLPLAETAQGLVPVAGEGLLILLSEKLLQREGELSDLVWRVVRWQGGAATELTAEQWRQDPLVASSLQGEFAPSRAELVSTSTRVVNGHELLCEDFELTAADTQRVDLPRGRLEQISLREITASLNTQVPFLGIAFASERTQSLSRLDPPSARFALPPPAVQVETMELLDYGEDAQPTLSYR